ncbi:MAG: hypothetical protein ABEI98_08580 [Halorhabdus sp.]
MSFEDSLLYNDWARAVKQGTPNDFVICITASSKTLVSGTGKTTLETNLAQKTDLSGGGFDATEKATLDAGELAYEVVPSVPSQSAVCLDEAQGAPGTVGLDSRRAMKQEAIDAISSILANRDKQLTIIITAQQFSMLDPRVYPIIDAWLLIRKGPDHPEGPLGTYHNVYVEDYNLANPKVKTPGVEDFDWPRVAHDDPDYRHLEKLKQKAKRRGGDGDGDGESAPQTVDDMPIEVRNNEIQRLYNQGLTQDKIANIFDLTQPTVSDIISG